MVDVTKLYRFEQTLNGYKEPYFQMVGTLQDIMAKWWRNVMSNSMYLYVDSSFNIHQQKVAETLNKQGFYIEIVDESLYGICWMTKIKEIKE